MVAFERYVKCTQPREGEEKTRISSDLLTLLPSGDLTELWFESSFLMGKITIYMAIFTSYFDITRG